MPAPAANHNGHQRRKLRARILATQTHCAVCGHWVDKTLTTIPGQHTRNCPNPQTCKGCQPHPMRPEIDENTPRSRGGNPLNPENCNLTHRTCNQQKGTKTLAELKQSTPQNHKPTTQTQW